MLPYSLVIKGRAYRALVDGTIQTMINGSWHLFDEASDHAAARTRLNMWRASRAATPQGV